MKLHLPKLLLTAVLAAVGITQTAWAVTGWADENAGGGYPQLSAYYVKSGDNDNINATDRRENIAIRHDQSENTALTTSIDELTLKEGQSVLMETSRWGSGRSFELLTINKINASGSFDLTTTGQENTFVIKEISGTVSGINNAAKLTLGVAANEEAGTAASTTNLAGTITNTGTMTVNGTLAITSLDGFSKGVVGGLTNTTHGYQQGKEGYAITTGNVTQGSGFAVTLNGTAITDKLQFSNGSLIYCADGAATTTGTLYVITSAYKEAVVYDGNSGDTAAATGFRLENGTTVKLTGDSNAGLTEGITIAAGAGGKATVMFANGKPQRYASLGLGSLINVESGSYVLGISGSGTVVTTTHQNNATGFHGGEIFITDGGKLLLDGYDSLGWEGTATPKISILNGTLALSGRQTFSTDLDMQGGAIVEANSTTIADNPPKIDVWTNMDWTVRGTGNVVKNGVAVNMRQNVNIAIASGGELSIQGAFEGGSKLTKSGDGKLILDGVAKTLNGQLQMQSGTLQLGGTTAADSLVTLAGGLNQTGGTVDVVGKAKIQGTSTLGGAITVASTGELTLNSTYVLTGSFTVAKDGKVIGGNDLIRGASSGRPAERTNGWDSTILTILQAAEGAKVTGLNTAWYNNGEFVVETSTGEDGVTSYLIDARFNYYVQDTDTKAEYSTATGLTGANTIYMNDGTTLVVKNDLNTSKVSVSEAGKVNYEVDGANLTLAETAHSNIASVTLTQGAKLTMSWNSSIAEKISIGLSDGSLIAMRNGGAGHVLNADINVNGTGYISGSSTGNDSNVQGTIYGKGTLGLLRDQDNENPWTVSAEIKDGSDGSLSVQVYGGKLDNGSPVTAGNNRVTLSGNNSYSGGTTIYGGTLTAAHAAALGTGNIEVKSGAKLAFNTIGTISNTISGAGTVIKEGSGLLTLTGVNTFSGGTTITDGQVVLGNDKALGTGMIKLQGGSIEITENRSLSMNVDMANSNDFTGKINITSKKELLLSTDANIWIGSNAAINLADDAKFTYGSLSVIGTGNESYITRAGGNLENANKFGTGSVHHIVNNAEVTVTSEEATELKLQLIGSSVTNAGKGALTVTHENNTLTEVHATGGNISLQNVGAALSLDVLEMATGKTVNVGFAANVADQGVTVSSTASLLSGSRLNTSLTLSEGATLDMDGTVTIDGALNIEGALTMGDKLSAMLAEMSSWETPELVLFTGVSSFNGDAVATEAELASNYFTGASSDLYVEYRVDNNVGSIVIINRMDAVPEPASATLSLAALMMLCARRRRRK